MNERIKELASQTITRFEMDSIDGVPWPKENGDWIRAEDFGYFLDMDLKHLIVKECADFISTLDAEPVSHRTAAQQLLEHFGVDDEPTRLLP